MSDEGRKTNKRYTGTVPKVRHRNNISPVRHQENSAGYWQHGSDPSGFNRNPRRIQQNNYFAMNSTIEENGCTNVSSNGSPNTSLTTSRRNSSSSILKCDNVSKNPDKKQIEVKLHQIREYLKLMRSMKNTDEQNDDEHTEKLLNDLKDSEKKLVDILEGLETDNLQNGDIQASELEVEEVTDFNPHLNRKNEINVGNSRQEAEFLKEQQLTLLQLQQKAENKLRDARKISGNLLAFPGNQTNCVSNTMTSNGYDDFDVAIRELEEKTKTLGPTASANKKMQENILARVESLHNQIVSMHDANEEREKLIEALDTRDAELRQQQAELHFKLVELQNKKSQVDQLVTQLQTFANEEEEEDIGVKVRNIVTMKDQLNKLQDMLEVVKSAETTIINSNASSEAQAAAMDTCLNIESILEKDNQKPRLRSTVSNDSNVLRYDNDTSSEGRNKQTNKNKKDQILGRQKSALQSELEIKKRELEELMGKHKASTSNLNHDVGLDIKSEFSYTSNAVNEAWPAVSSSQRHQTDSDRFSSDDDYLIEEDDPLGSRNGGSASVSPLIVNFGLSKQRVGSSGPPSDRRAEVERRREVRNVRGGSVPVPPMAPIHPRHQQRNRSNSDKENKMQVHKQLQLIKSVCESMLEEHKQAPVQASPSGSVKQLRNDLTSSPLYSSAPPNIGVPVEAPWMPSNGGGDGHQGWLATNAIQTQSFLLSTLNQCCQMLWLQQRELAALRSAVTVLQERLESGQYPVPAAAPLDQHHMPSSLPSESQRSSANLYRYSGSGAKTNQSHQRQQQQVSAAFSLPNLNHYAATSPLPYLVDSRAQVPAYAPQVHQLGLNNHQELPNNTVLPPPANQMWLNNQIAPGNRANNYWDNFRSYSRQNLLSTKNCEVPQASPSVNDRSNANERTNPFSLISFSKCNSDQDSTSTSQENTPQRKRQEDIPPPDVLNVNQNIAYKSMDHLDLHSNEPLNGLQMLLNPSSTNYASSNNSNLSEDHTFKGCVTEQSHKRNEWSNESTGESKSKLFDELKENVYKEVASLISANETRPHFLIQLFRDLRMIKDDAVRLRILQSIQMVITHSMAPSHNPNRLGFSEYMHFLEDGLPFLNEHDDDIFNMSLLSQLKQIVLNSTSLRDAVKDAVFLKHFSNVLDAMFEQYLGRKVLHVKVNLLHTIDEMLIQFIHDNAPQNSSSQMNDDENYNAYVLPSNDHQNNSASSQMTENMQNGDLCEADQTRALNEEIDMEEEEEGAVGGIIERKLDPSTIQNTCDIDINLDFPTIAEGLDQVPTRLPTKVKSGSTTPSKDRGCRSDPDTF